MVYLRLVGYLIIYNLLYFFHFIVKVTTFSFGMFLLYCSFSNAAFVISVYFVVCIFKFCFIFFVTQYLCTVVLGSPGEI